MKQKLRPLEVFMNLLFFVCGLIAVVFVLFISIYLIVSGLPAIREIGLVDFLFGTEWASTAAEPKFGILPFILTSIYGTGRGHCPGRTGGLHDRSVPGQGSASPSGQPGAPGSGSAGGHPIRGVRSHRHDGSGACGAGGLPPARRRQPVLRHSGAGRHDSASIISVSETALKAVPKEYEEASLALGATHIETVFRVSVPAAPAASPLYRAGHRPGHRQSMAVIMVAGNVANMPGLFQSVRFLTTAVSSEMAYASGLQRQALFSIALVLFLFIMLINIVLNTLLKRKKG